MDSISIMLKVFDIEKTALNHVRKQFKTILSVLNDVECEDKEGEAMIEEYKRKFEIELDKGNRILKSIDKKINDFKLKQLN